MLEIDEERIRLRAFELSERAGHPEGQHEAFWHAARLELMSEDQAAQLSAELPEAVLKRA